jgi:poly(glycerol-phosphate) alpha-glucosyltransferase
MKIAVFTCSVSRTAGGLLDAVRDLYKAVKGNTTTVYSYIDECTDEDLPSWSPIEVKLYKQVNGFFYSPEAKNDLLNSDSDVLHVHGLWRYPHAFITTWKKKTRKPVVVTPHGMLDPYILKNQGIVKRIVGHLLFAGKAFKNVDCYHALNLSELDAIRKDGHNQPVAIIPNGINLPLESLHFEKSDNKKHLLFLGRLHPKKGVDMLIKAVGELKNDNPVILNGWVIDVVGWAQENFEQTLYDLVKKYQLQDIIKFHGGLFGEEKQRAYATADAYILPSHGEGLPMTVLEAWSWKVPVVMTPLCNIPEGFEHNAAIKVENTTPSVKEGLIALLSMTDAERRQMGENGRKLVEKQFTWEISARKMEELYEWLLGTSAKPDFVHNE